MAALPLPSPRPACPGFPAQNRIWTALLAKEWTQPPGSLNHGEKAVPEPYRGGSVVHAPRLGKPTPGCGPSPGSWATPQRQHHLAQMQLLSPCTLPSVLFHQTSIPLSANIHYGIRAEQSPCSRGRLSSGLTRWELECCSAPGHSTWGFARPCSHPSPRVQRMELEPCVLGACDTQLVAGPRGPQLSSSPVSGPPRPPQWRRVVGLAGLHQPSNLLRLRGMRASPRLSWGFQGSPDLEVFRGSGGRVKRQGAVGRPGDEAPPGPGSPRAGQHAGSAGPAAWVRRQQPRGSAMSGPAVGCHAAVTRAASNFTLRHRALRVW